MRVSDTSLNPVPTRFRRLPESAARCVPAFLAAGLLFFPVPATAYRLASPEFLAQNNAHLKTLTYLNPERDYTRPKIASLDDAIRLYRANLATDVYMRDSLGISQAKFEILAAGPGACDSLRDRVMGILESIRLRFRAGTVDRLDLGPAEGYWLNPGQIPAASAYFALRDSLTRLRAGSVRVLLQEVPYRSSLLPGGDSVLAFLNRLRDLTQRENGAFRGKLLESLRIPGLDYPITRGLDCSIAVGRLVSGPAAVVKSQADLLSLPGFLRRQRDQPLILRIDSLERIAWSALALAAVGFLLGLGAVIAFGAARLRKQRVSRITAGE